MNALPKFDFSGMSNLTDEVLTEATKPTQREESKFFRPGLHELEVVESKFHSLSESDPTWAKWIIRYQGTGEKKTSDLVLVPLKDVTKFNTRDGENSTYPAIKLKNLIEALGEKFSVETLPAVLKKLFSAEDALKGMKVAAKMGYAGMHVKYVGQSEQDTPQVRIVTRKGEPVEKYPVFNSYADANQYAEVNNIPIKSFCDILEYLQSSTPNSSTTDSNW